MIEWLLFLIGVAADQAVKLQTAQHIPFGSEIQIIPGFFSLAHVVNRGAAWSFLAGHSWGIHLLTGVSFVALIGLVYAALRLWYTAYRLPLIAMASGCLGNLIDRFLHQGVVDMFSFRFGSYQFPVFNVADILLVCGTLSLAAVLIYEEFRNKNKPAAETATAEEKTPEKEERE